MKPIRLIIVAVGGQGNLLASKVLGDAAMRANIPVAMSEIHGMAQRGGVVESALIFGDAKSSIISDNEADILLGFEPSETLRALNKCHKNSWVITNMSPLPPFTVNIGKGKYPELEFAKSLIQQKTARSFFLNATGLAQEAGNILSVNIVLLGALTATGIIPLSQDQMKNAIRNTVKKSFVDMNINAFELGVKAIA
jgi:indolepyruvate ferredoxin oxidoreductase beta subunit